MEVDESFLIQIFKTEFEQFFFSFKPFYLLLFFFVNKTLFTRGE